MMLNKKFTNTIARKGMGSLCALVLALGWIPAGAPIACLAQEKGIEPEGLLYELGESDYVLDEHKLSASGSAGTLTINGPLEQTAAIGNVTAYFAQEGDVSFSYTFHQDMLPKGWEVNSDKAKKINGVQGSEKIQSGALLVETSMDGTTWKNSQMNTNVLADPALLQEPFYEPTDIHMRNGTYYRVTMAYQLKHKRDEPKKILFLKFDQYDYERYIDTYTFYLKREAEPLSIDTTPRMVLGDEPVKMKLDSGYSQEQTIDVDDPHFGWSLGSFVVNGYTEKIVKEDDTPVFLKNVGDQVILWFSLDQEIDQLNGNPKLKIVEDKDGYDQKTQTPKTNFKKGALLIEYKDSENKNQEPLLYTDYLSANTETGADTIVQLFEEGDYSVILDYEIEDSSGLIKKKRSDYQIAFDFSVRNSNCMVFPFDLGSGSELSDGALTKDGFTLDLANSKYLEIDIEYYTVKENKDGTLSTDQRSNKAAKENTNYTDAGMYKITVKNPTTNATSTKTLYVGISEAVAGKLRKQK